MSTYDEILDVLFFLLLGPFGLPSPSSDSGTTKLRAGTFPSATMSLVTAIAADIAVSFRFECLTSYKKHQKV